MSVCLVRILSLRTHQKRHLHFLNRLDGAQRHSKGHKKVSLIYRGWDTLQEYLPNSNLEGRFGNRHQQINQFDGERKNVSETR